MKIDDIYYNLDSLYLMTFLIFVAGTIIIVLFSQRFLLSVSVSFFKALIFLIYYYYFFNQTDFTLPDSLTYLENTKFLVENISFDNLYNELDIVWFVAGGRHIFYYIYSYFLCKIFGVYYFVPIAFNIIITYFGAYFSFKIGLLIGFKRRFAIGLSIFYLLHWDIIAWSVFNNIRDILISTLIMFALYIIIKLTIKINLINIFFLGIILWILNYLRFYFVVFIIGTYLIYYFITSYEYLKYHFNQGNRRFFNSLLLMSFLSIVYVFYVGYEGSFDIWFAYSTNPIYGTIRFFLTPIPFYELYNGYGYLHFASMLHWMMIPFLFYGWYKLYYLNKNIFILLSVFILIVILFFGVFTPVQGPRHRLTVVPFLIIFQYIGLFYMIKRYQYAKNSSID